MSDRGWDEASPDGRTLVRWSESDGRMSHVIRTPTIVDAESGQTILRFGDGGFDAEIAWGTDGCFDIDLRHYWRPGTLRLRVDRAASTFQVCAADGAEPAQPLAGLSDFIEVYFAAAEAVQAADARAAAYERTRRLAREWGSSMRALWIVLAFGAGAAIWALFFRH